MEKFDKIDDLGLRFVFHLLDNSKFFTKIYAQPPCTDSFLKQGFQDHRSVHKCTISGTVINNFNKIS